MVKLLESTKNNKPFVVAYFLLVYGLSHALVDASCAFLVMGAIDVQHDMWLYIIFYNALAFGLQMPLGLLLDNYCYPKIATILGLVFIIGAYIFFITPMAAVILAGLGNALFHVGGGKIALTIDSKKAIYPAIFVAPGGIGLALGIYLSVTHIVFNILLFPILLVLMIGLLLITKVPTLSEAKVSKQAVNYILLIILFLVLSISIRSLIGLTISFPWKSNPYLLILLTASIAFGKVFGGILADRFGWIKTGLSGLLLAAPLLAFGATYPIFGLVGIFVFNFTMPITLVAISNALPGRAGFAFGITTLALFMGAIPTYTHSIGWITQEWVVFIFVLLAAVFLYLGLSTFLNKKVDVIEKD